MSGHSKWSTIKNKKAATDSKKGKTFSIIGRQIRIAVREGRSGDPEQNPTLRTYLEKAKQANMPKENIQRAIEKGLGKSASGTIFKEVIYEGYGPGGVGYRIFVVTENHNRTGAEVRALLERSGGSMGGPGSTAYLFSSAQDGSVKVLIPMPVSDEVLRAKVASLTEALEELDDVESVNTNISE